FGFAGGAWLAAAVAVVALALPFVLSNAAPAEGQAPAGASLDYDKKNGTLYIEGPGPIVGPRARAPGWGGGVGFKGAGIVVNSRAAKVIGRANSKHRHRCGQPNSSHDCRAMNNRLSHHRGDGFERARSFAAS